MPNVSDRRQRLGRRGEELAVAYLQQAGYDILERNWRCRAGEVDIVARHGPALVLVEVRTRSGRSFGSPEESIRHDKRATLILCGQYLVAAKHWTGPWRIDVVAIEMGADGQPQRITLIPNAVEG